VLNVIPVRELMIAPVRFVPVSVTPTVVPCTPLTGEIPLSVGRAVVTVNVTALLVPPGVVTVTLCGPVAAVLEMLNVAVTDVAVALTPLNVIPPRELIVAPVRFIPASVTGTEVPCIPLAGKIPVSVGGGGAIVKVKLL
jgi:hypothetical protein